MIKNKRGVNPSTDFKPGTDTLVYALGGLGEVGKNMYCVEHDDEIIIVDAGVKFPGENLLGVNYVIPDFDYLVKNKDKVKALIITHGHEDHIGGIPFLMKVIDIPVIYAPKFATFLIRKKLEERKMLKQVKIVEFDGNSKVQTKHLTVGFFSVIHSIPDAYGVYITSPNGKILMTGDFKFDLTPYSGNTDYQKLAFIGSTGVTLALSDSTNSAVNDFSLSEKKVGQQIDDIMKNVKGRFIVASFASNLFRVAQILEAAVANGKKVAVFGRSMENVVEIGKQLGHINIPNDSFVKAHQLKHIPADKLCIVCTGSQGEPMAALSRIANGTHRQVQIMPGDTVAFSSSPIPGNSESINKILNSLSRAGATVLTKSVLSNLHTTGHASQEEQKLLLQLVKPKYFMPNHGENKMLKIHANTAIEVGIKPENVFVNKNGDALILRNEEVFRSKQGVHADDIYVDGNDASGLDSAVLKDRALLSDNGLVSVIVSIDSRNNKILCRPNILSRGFVYVKESTQMLREAEMVVYEALKKELQGKTNFGQIKNTVRDSLEPFFYEKTERNPIVIPVILNKRSDQV